MTKEQEIRAPLSGRLDCGAPVAWRYRIKDIDGNASSWSLQETKPEIFVLHDCEPLYALPPTLNSGAVIDEEEKYLLEHFGSECDIMPGDVEGSFHRIREALALPRAVEGGAVIERCAKWHEQEADLLTNSLHCGDNWQTIGSAHRQARWHLAAAKSLRALSHPNTGDGVVRCPVCDWPMADSQEKGCVPGDCSYRPDDPAEQERIRKRRDALRGLSVPRSDGKSP